MAYIITQKGTRTCHVKQWPSPPSEIVFGASPTHLPCMVISLVAVTKWAFWGQLGPWPSTKAI
jgi:hypothetical protein